MNDRPRRPTPRTLSAPPPPSTRAPLATRYVGRFPALATLLAGGAVIPACHSPECRSTRADELESHGLRALNDVNVGRAGDALGEIGVALGLSRHPPTRALAAGQLPGVTTEPTPPPTLTPIDPRADVDGAMGEVSPLPTTVPHTPPPSAQSTQTTPHAPPNATTPRTPRETPMMPLGRVRRVTPSPRGDPPAGRDPVF